jgi:hypothetical protein
MREENTSKISRFGFRLEKVGVHISRTMMQEDLRLLLSYISSPDATKSDNLKAIKEDNCLGKRSGTSRKLAASHLVYLYSLDSSLAIFRSLHYFWNRDFVGQPIGWDPNLNDGVRLNIRPFLRVPDVGRKGTGVLQKKPNKNRNMNRARTWRARRGSWATGLTIII